jgi:hypothetical protein
VALATKVAILDEFVAKSRSTPVAITIASSGIRKRAASSARQRTCGFTVPHVENPAKRQGNHAFRQRLPMAVLVANQRDLCEFACKIWKRFDTWTPRRSVVRLNRCIAAT